MLVYKITKIYILSAPSKIAARNIFSTAFAQNKEDEFLEFVSITETDRAKPNGFANALKQQLVGSANTKR